MDCNIIKDLLPLYIDECCSKESADVVEEHLNECEECKEIFEGMGAASFGDDSAVIAPVKLKRINEWKASIMQSVLFFISFAIVTVGVTLEASSLFDYINGFWAFSLIIPATGFLLSLANWYFIKLYKSKKSFSIYSCLTTSTATFIAYIWAAFHYKITALSQAVISPLLFFGIGIMLTAVFCMLSKILSGKYAEMIGKE